MLVLLDCRPLQNAGPATEKSRFILSCAALLSKEHGVRWLFLVDHSYRPGLLPLLPGATPVSPGPPPTGESPGALLMRRAIPGRTGWKIWYDGQIPRLAKKYKTDLIMTTAGIAAAAGRVPQCVWLPPRPNPTPSTLQRADALFCFSEKDKAELSARFTTPEAPPLMDKIIVVPAAPDSTATPLSPAEKTQAKTTWTDGKEFFLADITTAPLPSVVNLLKAFSLFKKRQHSNMHLALLGAPSEKPGQLGHRLLSYKYRTEVQFHERPAESDRVQLRGAAYAILFLNGNEAPGLSLLNAWMTKVPVLAPPDSLLAEMGGDAIIPVAADDPTAMAGQLMRIYKDETFRSSLIAKGLDRLPLPGSPRPVDAIWTGMQLALRS